MGNKKKTYTIERNALFVNFALLAITADSIELKKSAEKIGFILLNVTDEIKNKKKSGSLLSVIYIVAKILKIDRLMDEASEIMLHHKLKSVREFSKTSLPGIEKVLHDNPNILQENHQLYLDFITPFLSRLGVKNISHEISKPIIKNRRG